MHRMSFALLSFVSGLLTQGALLQAQTDEGWEDWETGAWEKDAEPAFPVHGFVEPGVGSRLQSSPYHEGLTLGEARVRLETDGLVGRFQYAAKGDLLYDHVLKEWDVQARELTLSTSIGQNLDLKAGRQIMTWGTGDYLFLNDLFSKDWQAFFIGRDEEYLKAPQDTLRVSGYFDIANVELAWTPSFEADVYPRGERLSIFNPLAGQLIGKDQEFTARTPDDDELALRVYRNVGAAEWALYGYHGYHKSPEALSSQGSLIFSRLRAMGASVRVPLGPGLFNAEVSHHDSLDDPHGSNPHAPNNQWRGLLGYEKELLSRLTGSMQLYLEHTQDYAALLENSPDPEWESQQNRTLLTTRLTWRDARDRVTLSLFGFYSPSDKDGHLRPRLDYRFDDNLSLSTGFNLFFGEEVYSFFGQLEDNSNAYARFRYAF